MTIEQTITGNPGLTDAQVADFANDRIGWRTDELTFAAAADALTALMPGDTAQARADAAGAILDDAMATIAGHPSPSVQVIAGALTSGLAVAMGSAAVRGKLQSVLSPAQLGALLPLLRTAPLVTPEQVAAARVALIRADALRGWGEDQTHAWSIAAQTVVDLDPAGADVEAVIAAYAVALRARRVARGGDE